MPEVFANNAVTTLSAPATVLQTSLTVTSNDGFPSVTTASTNFFYATIGTEIVKVTNNPTTTWTVERGNQSTVAAVQAAGEVVYCVVTKQTMTDILAAASSAGGGTLFGTYAALPAAGTSGRLYFCSDSQYILRDNGTTWQAFLNGFPVTPPPLPASLTWVNQGTATAATVGGMLRLETTGIAGDQLRSLVKNYTGPRTLEVGFYTDFGNLNFNASGLLWKAAAGAGLAAVSVDNQVGGHSFSSVKWTNSTTFSAAYNFNTAKNAGNFFFRIQDDGANRIFSASVDNGMNYIQYHSVGRTDFINPDQYGIYVNSNNASRTIGMTVFHWREF